MEKTKEASPFRVAAAALILVAGFCLIAVILFFGISTSSVANRDYIEYWSAGQQLIHGANPYDDSAILQIERGVGYRGDLPKITFSPPVALVLALPLGLLSAKAGFTVWSLAILVSVSISIWILWLLNGRPDNRLHLLGFVFAPIVACQMAGQLGTFFLLAVVLFLYLHQSRPLLAGAALLPCASKPHLFLPFAMVLLFWIIWKKAYPILAGFAAAFLVSCSLPLYFDSRIWSQYSQMLKHVRVLDGFVPTLSGVLRLLLNPAAVWVQFLPEACGTAWAVWYFWTRRNRWSFAEQGLLVLLVSVACSPYAWVSDEAVLLPAILFGVYRAVDSGRSLLPIGLSAGVAMIEVLGTVRMTSIYYLWTVPAWLAWFLYSTSSKKSESERTIATERKLTQRVPH